MSDLVSVIIPCYNQAKFLPEALNSVLDQTYKNWECIMVNDGSLDNSEQIAKAYCDKDVRFKYIKKENGGLSSARNSGLKVAKGKWIQFLDADDYIASEKLQHSIDAIEKDKALSLVVTNYKMFVDNVKLPLPPFRIIKQEHLNFESIVYGWDNYVNIPIHSGLFKADLFVNNPFVETVKVKEDLIMWLHIFIKNIKALYLDEPLAFYRINPNSMTKDQIYLHHAQADAYRYIINFLPEKYSRAFSAQTVVALTYEVAMFQKEIDKLRNKFLYKAELNGKGWLRKIVKPKN